MRGRQDKDPAASRRIGVVAGLPTYSRAERHGLIGGKMVNVQHAAVSLPVEATMPARNRNLIESGTHFIT